jgi:hypothetical protein
MSKMMKDEKGHHQQKPTSRPSPKKEKDMKRERKRLKSQKKRQKTKNRKNPTKKKKKKREETPSKQEDGHEDPRCPWPPKLANKHKQRGRPGS